MSDPAESTFGCCAELGGLEWLRGSDLAPFAPHTHETFSIGLVRGGANVFRRGGALAIAEAGTVCLVNPGDVHTGGEGPPRWRLWNFYPTEDQLRRAAEGLCGQSWAAPRFRRPVVTDADLARAIQALFCALEAAASALEREAALLAALSPLVARHAERPVAPARVGAEPRAVRLARDYLHAHVADDVPLAALADVASLSPYHFARVFRAALGMPPHAYHGMLRLERAKRLILAGHSIAHAARACGFADQAHLTRRFRRAYGVTPGQVARASKNVQDRRARGA